jgi:sec-independent protein translocase protein TatA
MLPNVGIGEIALLLLVALLLFGPARLPEMARQLGKGIRDFKEAVSGIDQPLAPAPVATTESLYDGSERSDEPL